MGSGEKGEEPTNLVAPGSQGRRRLVGARGERTSASRSVARRGAGGRLPRPVACGGHGGVDARAPPAGVLYAAAAGGAWCGGGANGGGRRRGGGDGGAVARGMAGAAWESPAQGTGGGAAAAREWKTRTRGSPSKHMKDSTACRVAVSGLLPCR